MGSVKDLTNEATALNNLINLFTIN